MNSRDRDNFLKANGFFYLKEVRHGSFWTDGLSTILLQKNPNSVNIRNFIADVKRKVRMREAPTKNDPITIPKKEIVVVPEVKIKRIIGQKNPATDRVAALMQEGLGAQAILAKLTEEGFKTITDRAFTIQDVHGMIFRVKHGPRKKEKKPVKTQDITPQPVIRKSSNKCPDTVQAIMTDPDLTEGQKYRMIVIYFENK